MDDSSRAESADSPDSLEADGRLSTDAILEILSDSRRRTVVALLLTHDRPLTVADLTKLIARHELDADITNVDGEKITGIRLILSHNHVPKLVDVGLIEHDESRDLVEPTAKIDQFEPYLSVVEKLTTD